MKLGDWTTRSGNNVIAYYVPGAVFPEPTLMLAWDRTPPLSPPDEHDYLTTIRPALLARVREYSETTGSTLLVDV